jgi:signal transduction histidine kinase
MKTPDLRVRVAAAVAITCIAVVTALALTLYTASEDLEETLVEQIVGEEMAYLVKHHLDNPGIVVREPGPNLQYYVVRNTAELELVPQSLRALPTGRHEVGAGINEKHVAVHEVSGTRFIVAYDSGQHEVREQQFKHLLLFALATVTMVAAGLGYWIAGLLTHQITELSARVSALDPGAPRALLAQEGQDAEVSALARAFDQYETRIRELLAREREFTGNASHELRTPLTAIRTSCELLETEPGLTDKAKSRIAGIAAAADRMTGQIEMLLFIARSQASGTMETVAVAECVDNAVHPLLADIAAKRLAFENTVPVQATLTLNRQALDIVLTNLLRNAVMYTERGHIRVSLADGCLSVTDSGIGIPAAQLPHIFSRFHRGDARGEGFGIGLDIVKRICNQHGWRIEAESVPSQGTTFRLHLS